jgi:hypothetical protein
MVVEQNPGEGKVEANIVWRGLKIISDKGNR